VRLSGEDGVIKRIEVAILCTEEIGSLQFTRFDNHQ
jgi:hypothetical protein